MGIQNQDELGIINLCGVDMQMTYGWGEAESTARMTLVREVVPLQDGHKLV